MAEINSILLSKQGNITLLNDNITEGHHLTIKEISKLQEGRKKLGVYLISKSDSGIYYELWGFLDVRLGITYKENIKKEDTNYKHLIGNWFH